MKRFPILLAAIAAVPGIATELHVFSAGQAAKAQEVNDNFQRLDTAIQNRATKVGLESTDGALKTVMATVGTLQTGKAEKSDLDALSAKQKTDVATLAKATVDSAVNLRNAIPTGRVDSAWVASKFVALEGDGAFLKQLRVFSSAADQVDGATWYGVGKAKLPSLAQTGTEYQVQLAGFYGLRLRSKKHTLDLPESQESAVTIDGNVIWHAGNLNPLINSGKITNPAVFSNPSPPMGSWQVDIGGVIPNAPNESWNIQVFSTGTQDRGLQIASAYNWDDIAFRRGCGMDCGASSGWQPWVHFAHSGNFKEMASNNGIVMNTGGTISGDLRITGKLTTPPGAEPADYVFEPDYKLAPLSEVEAFTKANKHLPEVPSAKEMTENGVDLAAMNMVLLKKVEELTLHAIALQKDLEAQKAQFEERLKRLESASR